MIAKPLADRFVVFSPDSNGDPMLIPVIGKIVLDAFECGCIVSVALRNIHATYGVPVPTLLTIINALYETRFLRGCPDSVKDTTVRSYLPSAPRSLEIWLHINNTCNLGCSYCFVNEAHPGGSGGIMERATMDDVISRITYTAKTRSLSHINLKFAGGEPTLTFDNMKYFYETLLQSLCQTSTSLHAAILTNGTRIEDNLIRFVRMHDLKVAISLDGYRESHDKYRVFKHRPHPSHTSLRTVDSQEINHGKGSWATIERNIDRLLEHGVSPSINITASRATCQTLPRLVEWIFVEKALVSANFGIVRNEGCTWGDLEHQYDYAAYCHALESAFEAAFAVLENPKLFLQLPAAIRIAELSFTTPLNGICCSTGANHVVIRSDGNLASCPQTVREQCVIPTRDLVASTEATFRHQPWDETETGLDDCMSCKWFRVCAGQCPIANKRVQGQYFTKSALCTFWQYVIPRYVLFFGRKLLQAEKVLRDLEQESLV